LENGSRPNDKRLSFGRKHYADRRECRSKHNRTQGKVLNGGILSLAFFHWRIMKRFKSARQLQRFVSIHDPVANLFHFPATAFHRLTIATYEMLPWKHGGRSLISTLPENSKIRALSNRATLTLRCRFDNCTYSDGQSQCC
jgi:hypothetical protein